MYNTRSWNILNWNIRGINAQDKWLAIRQKVEESAAGVVCIQETKRELFGSRYLKQFCPKRLNKFDYQPSVGASGGLLVVWNDSLFSGETISKNTFSISIRFTPKLSSDTWTLSNIYGPCLSADRVIFMDWFSNIQIPDDCIWLMLGDFNYIRYPYNRNREEG